MSDPTRQNSDDNDRDPVDEPRGGLGDGNTEQDADLEVNEG
jgi:hypothetical protein